MDASNTEDYAKESSLENFTREGTVKVPVQLVLFGKARDLLDTSTKDLEIPKELNGQQLRRLIFHEILKELSAIEASCVLALNQKQIDDDHEMLTINAHTEIAVIPAIGGG